MNRFTWDEQGTQTSFHITLVFFFRCLYISACVDVCESDVFVPVSLTLTLMSLTCLWVQ